MNSSQEKPVTPEKVWKREREKFMLGASSLGRWVSSSLKTRWTPRVLLEENRGYVQESRLRARDHGWGSVCVQGVIMGREGDMWDAVF